jgi:hypothetical protein
MSNLSDNIERKFVASYPVDNYEILTDTGWEDISFVHKTIPYEKWKVTTENFELIGADNHIVFIQDGNRQKEIFLKDLKIRNAISN